VLVSHYEEERDEDYDKTGRLAGLVHSITAREAYATGLPSAVEVKNRWGYLHRR